MVNRGQKAHNDLNLFLKTYFSLFMLLAVIFFLALGYFLVLRPKYKTTLKTINDNFSQQEQYYRNQSEKLANLKALNEFYRKINPADLKKFNSVLPDKYDKERLFGELEEITNQNGFLIKSISLKDQDKDGGAVAPPETSGTSSPIVYSPNLGKIDITLSLGAVDYTGFKNLLRLLENNLRLFDITMVSFAPDSESTSLVLTTYYYKSNP